MSVTRSGSGAMKNGLSGLKNGKELGN